MLSRAPFIEENLESYMKHIISMISGSTSVVKEKILQGIVSIVDINAELILKEENFPIVAQLMLESLRIKVDERV